MDLSKYTPSIIKTLQELIRIKTVQDTPVEGGPFGKGNKKRTGYVVSMTTIPSYEPERIKEILDVVPGAVSVQEQMILLAWWMKERYGSEIFFNKDAWRFDTWLSWVYYLLLFAIVLFVIFNHPDFGTSVLYLAVFSAMISPFMLLASHSSP